MVELTHEEQRMYSHARDAVLSNLLTHTGHNCKRRKIQNTTPVEWTASEGIMIEGG
ncbi:hypothetical protein WJX82_002337 [Trebouxia sp. C0006]